MKRGIITALAVLAGWWGGANFASAQFIAPGFVSPFYPFGGGERPRPYGPIQMVPQNAALTNIQSSLNNLTLNAMANQQANATPGSNGMQTGHPTAYFNTSHYYPNTFLPGGSNTSSNTGFGPGAGLSTPGTSLGSNAGYNPTGAGMGGFSPYTGGFFGGTFGGGNRSFIGGGFR
jgi:hypothetical protein